jgi:hypothetical protein
VVGLGFGSPLPPLEILKIEKKDNKSTKSTKGFHYRAIPGVQLPPGHASTAALSSVRLEND